MIVLGFSVAFSVFKLHYYCQKLNLLCKKKFRGVFPTGKCYLSIEPKL